MDRAPEIKEKEWLMIAEKLSKPFIIEGQSISILQNKTCNSS